MVMVVVWINTANGSYLWALSILSVKNPNNSFSSHMLVHIEQTHSHSHTFTLTYVFGMLD